MSTAADETNAKAIDDPHFDPDEMRERYRIEREKRLREDGNDQYVEVTGEFSHYLEDPYVEARPDERRSRG